MMVQTNRKASGGSGGDNIIGGGGGGGGSSDDDDSLRHSKKCVNFFDLWLSFLNFSRQNIFKNLYQPEIIIQ
jgi:hypothetical protein